MFALAFRPIAAVALFAGPAALLAQVKVTAVSAGADLAPYYRETTWTQLRGRGRLTNGQQRPLSETRGDG